jgi:PIN domain nuclease of toxin-antitoxin system
MRLLLDTHVLLWWLANNPRLSAYARAVIADSDNQVFVSAVSAWEIEIKRAIGKLEAPEDLLGAIAANDFERLDIKIEHSLWLRELPLHHNDPFDRMLIAQALYEDLTLLSGDKKIALYEVPKIDA